MKYVDWVELVLRTTVHAVTDAQQGMLVGLREIKDRLAHDASVPDVASRDVDDAVWNAVQDLEALGLLDADSIHWVKITQEARKVRQGVSLRTVWPTLAERFLEAEQEAFLQKAVELSEERHDQYANVRWVEAAEVVAGLGWEDDVSVRYAMTSALEGEALVRQRAAMGGWVSLRPTYAGVVRATEVAQAKWQSELSDLVRAGETANVDFKRELNLETEKQKAEFVRDVLALANTNVSGPRYLIVGYEPRELKFHASVDPSVTQDRIEDILNAWTAPVPAIRFSRVEAPEGEVGVLQVMPERAHVPYRPARAYGKVLVQSDIFVRHGSHVERPTESERAEIEKNAG